MSEPILFITTFQIHEGKLREFKEAAKRSMEFLEANGPQLLAGVRRGKATPRRLQPLADRLNS